MPKPTDIELSVNLSAADTKKSAGELKKTIEDVFNKSAGGALDSKLKNLQQQMSATAGKANSIVKQMEKLEQQKLPTAEYTKATSEFEKVLKASQDYQAKVTDKILALKQRMEELKTVQLPTDKYRELQEYIDRTEAKLEKLGNTSIKLQKGPQTAKTVAKLEAIEQEAERLQTQIAQTVDLMNDMEEKGQAFKLGVDTDEYTQLQSQLDGIYSKGQQFADSLQTADDNMRNLVNSGKAFTLGSDTEEYAKLSNDLADLNNKQRITIERWNEQAGAEENVSSKTSKLSALVAMLSSKMGETAKNADKATPAIKRLNKATQNYSKSARQASTHSGLFNGNLKKMTLSFVKAMIGVRGLYALFRKLREAIVEGVKNLVLWEGESGKLNKSLSAISSSFATLKNSIGAAVAPLINALAPALTKIIDLLTVATNKVAMFIAAFSGSKTYLVADKVQKNYAAGLADTAKNAKKAEKALKGYLSPLDEINQYQDNKNDDDSLGGGTDTGTFSEIPIDPKFLAWLDEIKAKLQDIIDRLLGPFKTAWAEMGDLVKSTWIAAWEAVKDAVWDVADTFLDVWDSAEYGVRFVENILQIVIDIGNWVRDIAVAFKEAWDEGERGKQLFESMFDAFNGILELIHTIGESMRTVWNSGFGKEFIADMLEIMTNINNFFANLANKFREAWEQNDVGTRIIQDISDIVLDFTDMLNKMTSALSDWAAGLDFSPLLESFENLTDSIEPLVDLITDGLAWAWENVMLPLGSWVIEDAVPEALDVFSAALDVLVAVLEKLKPYVEAFFDNFLKPLGEFVWDNIQEGLEAFRDVLQGIADVLNGNQSFDEFIQNLSPLEVGILAVATAIGVVTGALALFSAGAAIASAVGGVLAGAIALITSPVFLVIAAIAALIAIGVLLYQNWDTIKEKASELWESIKEGFEHFKEKIEDGIDDIKEHFETFKENLKKIWDSIKENIKKTWDDIKSAVKERVEHLKQTIKTNIDKIRHHFETFRDNIKKIWENIKSSVREAWENIARTITDKVENAKASVKSRLDSIKQYFRELKENIVSTVKGIWDGIKGHLNNIISGFESLINRIISGVNSMINKLNTFSFELPDWVPGIGGNKFGFNIKTLGTVSIPRLAEGAVIPPNQEFMAILGDQKQGTNIETPLDTMVQAFKQAMSEMGGGIQTLNLILPNKKLVAQYAVEGGRVIQTSTGKNPFDLL